MKVIWCLTAVSLAVAGAAAQQPNALRAALADPARPPADVERDVLRKPAEVLAFAGVKPGDVVADYAAGSGYFTRIMGTVVGPTGHVYATYPTPLIRFAAIAKGLAEMQAWAATHPNVSVTVAGALDSARFAQPLDLFWIAQNYHDLRDPFMGPVDMGAFNQSVFAALKPGGTYLILDHVAAPGAPADVSDTLHRIEVATVRHEVEAAGFRFVSASPLLANPQDPHTAAVQDPSIRGRTDQFILKFRKP